MGGVVGNSESLFVQCPAIRTEGNDAACLVPIDCGSVGGKGDWPEFQTSDAEEFSVNGQFQP